MINIRYLGSYRIMYHQLQTSKSISESIRIIDAKNKEYKYIKDKYLNFHKLIDCEARNCFPAGSTTISMLKCTCSFNHYATQNKIVNYGMTVEKYPQYSRREI